MKSSQVSEFPEKPGNQKIYNFPYFFSGEEVAQKLDADVEKGLTSKQVVGNKGTYGENKFPPPPKKSILAMIIDQFKDQMVIILLIAVLIGFVFAFMEHDPEERTTAFIEPFVIVVILILNATISVLQEIKADESVANLKTLQPNKANVIRDGSPKEISADEVVVGDIIEVGEGFQIPADCRIIKIKSTILKVEQSALTGESEPVDKFEESLPQTDAKVAIQDQKNIAFGGCVLTRGRFVGVVIRVGHSSEIGKIQKAVDEAENVQSPLEIKLEKFGSVISKAIFWICVLTWVVNIPNFKEAGHGNVVKGGLVFFKIAVSLAVAAIPEGLPAVVTTTLSLGVNRMAASNAIVTHLKAVETLGCTSVICSDKTGTLTTNQMVVAAASVVHGDVCTVFKVTGTSYDSNQGRIEKDGEEVQNLFSQAAFQKCAFIASTANDAEIMWNTEKKEYTRKGEPTDASLKVFAEKIGLPDETQDAERKSKPALEKYNVVHQYYAARFPKLRIHEFTRNRKSMSVIVQGNILTLKGAFEVVLSQCSQYIDNNDGQVKTLTEELKKNIDEVRTNWAGHEAYRCIGLAYKVDVGDYESWDLEKIQDRERDLIWAGSVGIIDPARDDVPSSIAECHKAGIRVIMCTGDNRDTATAIAKKISMVKVDQDVSRRVFSGSEWEAMSDEEKNEIAKHVCVLARVEPLHKLQLVNILQKQGHVVAMTGDGVNDAPALKKADIGVAMGTGTTVAQNAAKMILSDDSFATIVKAVSEGRAIYNNTTAFIRYLITSNIGEVVSCFLSSLMGIPTILRSTQLLFVNLVTDGLPATALGVNPAEPGVMDLPPRSKDEEIVNKFTLIRYLVGGIQLGIVTILAALYWYMWDPTGPKLTFSQVRSHLNASEELVKVFNDNTPSTMAMTVLVFVELFSAATAVSEKQSILVMPPYKNIYLILAIVGSLVIHLITLHFSWMQHIFATTELSLSQWGVIIILAIPTLIIEEIFKYISRHHTPHAAEVE